MTTNGAVYNPPLGDGDLEFNTDDYKATNNATMNVLEGDARYSQTAGVISGGVDPLYTDPIYIGTGAGYSNALGCVNIGVDAGGSTPAQRTNSVALGYKCGYSDQYGSNFGAGAYAATGRQGKRDQSSGDGFGACFALGRAAAQYDQVEGSVSAGAFAGNVSAGYTPGSSSGAAVQVGYMAGKNYPGKLSICIGHKCSTGVNSGGSTPMQTGCVGINATGVAQEFGYDSAGNNVGGANRLYIKPIRGGDPDDITYLFRKKLIYNTSMKEVLAKDS